MVVKQLQFKLGALYKTNEIGFLRSGKILAHSNDFFFFVDIFWLLLKKKKKAKEKFWKRKRRKKIYLLVRDHIQYNNIVPEVGTL